MSSYPATEKQVRFATELGKAVALLPLDADQQASLQNVRDLWKTGLANGKTMSALIDVLKDLKKSLPTEAQTWPATEAPEGMHKFGGVIFKVQRAVHGSGHLYAKALVESDGGWTFEYTAGALRNLSASTLLPLEEAKAFGQLYGVCCVCGRTLTDETSIAEGIGPVCSGRFSE